MSYIYIMCIVIAMCVLVCYACGEGVTATSSGSLLVIFT